MTEQQQTVYRAYRTRWLVLLAVAAVTVSNNILWISFAAVNTYAADYYEKTPAQIDLLSMVSLVVGMPFCLAATWITDRLGLRAGVIIATCLTFAGSLLRCLSTLPGLNEHMSLEVQFWLGFAAQGITGMGNPIAVSLPTKVSQHWFLTSEREISTGILALSMPIGIAIGFGGTTLFVNSAEDIPLMNCVWFIPAAFTFIFVLLGMRSSKPPTPPSKSAEFDQESQPYLQSMKKLVTNGQFLLLVLAMGGAVGFFSAFLTLMQNMMCSRGYESSFSGLCGSLMLCTGAVGAVGSGWVVNKTGKMEETAKVMIAVGVLMGLGITEFIRIEEKEAALVTFCTLFGIFGFGFYPLGLELSVETVYPVDEASGTALIFLSGQVQGAILVAVSGPLLRELTPEAAQISVCTDSSEGGESKGQDYTVFLMLLAGYITLLGIVFIAFFRSDYKRQRANLERGNIEASQVDIIIDVQQID